MIQSIAMRVLWLAPRGSAVCNQSENHWSHALAGLESDSARGIRGLALVFLVICLGMGSPLPTLAQTNHPAGVIPANRYLLIVETSHAMKGRLVGTLRTVNDLIATRMRGQLHLGDTIGVWTYNDILSTGKLPLQEWSEGTRAEIAGKIIDFLKEQKFEKQGRMEQLLPVLMQVVKKSDFITIVLLSDGSQEFHGTPFDQQINQSYKQWSAQQQQAHMPFLTVLRARRGQFTNYSVTPAPFHVEMPPLPIELVKPKASPSLPVVSAPKTPPPPMAAPLIISGRKSEKPATNTAVTNINLVAQSPEAASNSGPSTKVPQSTVQTEPASARPDQSLPLAPANTLAATQPPPTPQTPTTSIDPKPASEPASESVRKDSPPATHAVETKPTINVSSSSLVATQSDKPVQAQNSGARPAPEVATAPAVPFFSATKLIVLGIVLICSALVTTIWLLKRRARLPAHVSLI